MRWAWHDLAHWSKVHPVYYRGSAILTGTIIGSVLVWMMGH